MQKQITSIEKCKNIKIVNLKFFNQKSLKIAIFTIFNLLFITIDFNDIFSIYITDINSNQNVFFKFS